MVVRRGKQGRDSQKRLERNKHHPKNREAARRLVTRKKHVVKVTQSQIEEKEKELQELQAKANSQRVLKHKIFNTEARHLLQRIKKMKTAKQKQDGTFVPQQYQTLDTMRVDDKTISAHNNDERVQEELIHAETNDELRLYFTQNCDPRIYMTTSLDAGPRVLEFCQNIVDIFGGTVEFHRRYEDYSVRDKAIELASCGYTSMIIIQADNSKRNPSHLMLIALPQGPSAYFRLTNVYTRKELVGAVEPIPNAPPEALMTNFKTRLGRRVGRLLQQTLSMKELLQARQVITFHNQRDFIFFRAYCYVFDVVNDEQASVRMSEIGPEFSMRLRWLQVGIYNPQYEEYEFVQNPHVESTNRKLFFL